MKAASLTHSSSESCLPSLTRHFSIKRTRLAASQFHDETLGIPLSWLSIPVELKRVTAATRRGRVSPAHPEASGHQTDSEQGLIGVAALQREHQRSVRQRDRRKTGYRSCFQQGTHVRSQNR
ncbi:hypothetical protein PC118_g18394 [Phytophthora cactorum]|uniref:Uncharacterized protein n=1 Tax=Phytophthora cactorum TaxID=29920 RepID=A0A8T1FB86_9STRA|nr:hypothetical protein PC118_g18394 [Phytophthora cactorum]